MDLLCTQFCPKIHFIMQSVIVYCSAHGTLFTFAIIFCRHLKNNFCFTAHQEIVEQGIYTNLSKSKMFFIAFGELKIQI